MTALPTSRLEALRLLEAEDLRVLCAELARENVLLRRQVREHTEETDPAIPISDDAAPEWCELAATNVQLRRRVEELAKLAKRGDTPGPWPGWERHVVDVPALESKPDTRILAEVVAPDEEDHGAFVLGTKERTILYMIKKAIEETGRAPEIEALRAGIGASRSHVSNLLKGLEDRGFIRRPGKDWRRTGQRLELVAR